MQLAQKPAIAVAEDRRRAEPALEHSPQVVSQYVLDRMRRMARDSALIRAQMVGGWEENRRLQTEHQTLHQENAALRAEADCLRAAKTQLAAILNSRTYRLAQLLRSICSRLVPEESLRRRIATAGFQALRRFRHRSTIVSLPARPSPAAPPALREPLPGPAALAAELSCRSMMDVPEPAGGGILVNDDLDWVGPEDDAALLYSPLSWQPAEKTPPDVRFLDLVILSPVHRSGSTLLQRICNARKGTLIWGEHGGLLAHFANIYASAAYFSAAGSPERVDYFGQGENPNLWIADMCPELDYVRTAVVDSATAFLRTFYGQYRDCHNILGFKEVHYGREELDLLRACCPQTEIILLVRNPLATWKSTPRDWYLSLDEWIDRWATNVRYFTNFARTDARCHLLRYEDVVRQAPEAMGVLSDVAKVTGEEVSMVLANKIGSMNAGISESQRATILERCREPMEALGYW